MSVRQKTLRTLSIPSSQQDNVKNEIELFNTNTSPSRVPYNIEDSFVKDIFDSFIF